MVLSINKNNLFPSPPCSVCHLLLLLVIIPLRTLGLVRLPPNVTIPAVFVFGDSIMDTGNNNNNLKTEARCNFPPYGEDLEGGGMPTGRFSNGKVPSDFVVEELGIKELLPAYLDPNLQPTDLVTGVCFASGGAGYDPLTSKLASAIHFDSQIEMFKDYIGKLRGVVGEERAEYIIENSLYLVVMGSNDISNTYFLSHVRQLEYDVPAYTDLLLRLASTYFKEIYELGARRIGVFSTPPIGCVPFQRTVAGGITRQCVDKINDACKLFNAKLPNALDSLNRNLPDSRFVFIDVYNPLLDVIVNYPKYGYKVEDRGCCGTGKIEVTFLCTQLQPTCPNVLDHVFWDSFHPTQSVYKKLVASVLQKYIQPLSV
ncbi:hypothetical protein HN51_038632 [Arachis hypogaea]|nr:GDSL esterase/lipase EXL3-like isoform X1 [Arachis ipaensis]QHN84023.1 GDSL esterase/lipase [Arachis hypogaea]